MHTYAHIYSLQEGIKGTKIHTYTHACTHAYMRTCIHTALTLVHQQHKGRNNIMHAYIQSSCSSARITKATYLYTYIHTNTHSYMSEHNDTYMHTYIHAYIHTYSLHAHLPASQRPHTCVHTYIQTHSHTCLSTTTHTCIHTYMLTYIHTAFMFICPHHKGHILPFRELLTYFDVRYLPVTAFLGFRNRIGASEPFLSQRFGTRFRR